jgi:ATP/maltotriose-dependent transcriptional regulator MalT
LPICVSLPAEAAEFLNQMMGLNLSAEDIAALEARTEGWIAGLQLGCNFNAGTSRHHQLHQIVYRQPPFRAGLSG